jgi:hypothetical protein
MCIDCRLDLWRGSKGPQAVSVGKQGRAIWVQYSSLHLPPPSEPQTAGPFLSDGYRPVSTLEGRVHLAEILDSIDLESLKDIRDKAIFSVLFYSWVSGVCPDQPDGYRLLRAWWHALVTVLAR